MKAYVDRDELIKMLYRADVSSREKIEELIMRAPTYQISDSRYGIGYSDGREAQRKFYAAEKEAIRRAVDRIERSICNIMSTCEMILYCDRRSITNSITIIKDLCEEDVEKVKGEACADTVCDPSKIKCPHCGHVGMKFDEYSELYCPDCGNYDVCQEEEK